MIIEDGFSWTTIGGLTFSVGLGLFFLFQYKWENWLTNLRENRIKKSNCILRKHDFYFPNGYYFQFGFLKNRKDLPFDNCLEIRLNTDPITVVTYCKEVIFLKGLDKQTIINSGIFNFNPKNRTIITSPPNNWLIICQEILNEDVSTESKFRSFQRLSNIGLSKNEIDKIRKRIFLRIFLGLMVINDFEYPEHFDVLRNFYPLTKKKYWWTMKIALRNNSE
jgi:hypothetical protein